MDYIICKSIEEVEKHQENAIQAMKQHNLELEETINANTEVSDSKASKKASKNDNKKSKEKKSDAAGGSSEGEKIEINQFQVTPSGGTVGVQGFKNIEIFMEGLHCLYCKIQLHCLKKTFYSLHLLVILLFSSNSDSV